MLPKDQNELLTRTGADTLMGRFMRRYWVPALLSEEIPAPDSPPAQVRILGEELVAFRNSQGRIGLLEEHCPHRGTSLFYGRNESCGLRCIYHGWKFDVDGNVLETPAEPPDSEFRHKIRQASYPVHEAAGVIWAYLGPRDKMPVFPAYAFAQTPLDQTYVTKCLLECNYLQGLEGECDSAHLSFLHRETALDGDQSLYQGDTAPQYHTEETDFGIRLVATRKASETETYVRVSSFVVPVSCWVPAGRRRENHMYVPYDDTHAWRYDMGFLNRPVTEEDRHRARQIGPDYRRIRTMANHYLQDRRAQLTEDFTGIEDFLNEDACATETMGPIFDRSREHLGASDKGVIAVRRYLLDAVRSFEAGNEPPHQVTDPEANQQTHIDTLAEVIPAGRHWREHFPHLTLSSAAATTAVGR